MAAAGYIFENNEIRAPGSHTNDKVQKKDVAPRIEGRLNNVNYMAYAIDMFDVGATEEIESASGTKQFQYLISSDFLFTGLIYVALRRFQRQGQLEALRGGLALLFGVEDGVLSARDAVSAMAPDLLPREAGIKAALESVKQLAQ